MSTVSTSSDPDEGFLASEHIMGLLERLRREPALRAWVLLVTQRLKRLPVVSADVKLVGLISRADLVRELAYRWQCKRCGNLIRARRPPGACPRCGASNSYEEAPPLPAVAACPTCGKPLDR